MFPNSLMRLVFISSRALLKAQAMDMLRSHITVNSSTEKREKTFKKPIGFNKKLPQHKLFFLNQ